MFLSSILIDSHRCIFISVPARRVNCLLAHAQALETVGQEELEMLHPEAVMAGTAGDDNVWFKAIDAR